MPVAAAFRSRPTSSAAIRDGTLIGASLDVFETEPLDRESPLWDLPGVILTPHVAAASTPDAITPEILGDIRAFEAASPSAMWSTAGPSTEDGTFSRAVRVSPTAKPTGRPSMLRAVALWILGVPLFVIILLYVFHVL